MEEWAFSFKHPSVLHSQQMWLQPRTQLTWLQLTTMSMMVMTTMTKWPDWCCHSASDFRQWSPFCRRKYAWGPFDPRGAIGTTACCSSAWESRCRRCRDKGKTQSISDNWAGANDLAQRQIKCESATPKPQDGFGKWGSFLAMMKKIFSKLRVLFWSIS